MTGTVVTFYSYKGGVGRSFALANVGTLLGRWGFRVLCIDWDLEAPGLPHYFNSVSRTEATSVLVDDGVPGLVESFSDFQLNPKSKLDWNDRIILLSNTLTPGVSMLKAGRVDATYSKRLHKLDWKKLYNSSLGEALEDIFEHLRQEYDFILIDSRTGVTDFSGITNSQLPDILVFLFTSNEQSLEGAIEIVRRAVDERNRLPLDRSRLFLLPIPSRFEAQLEHELSTTWKKRFSKELREFYEAWTRPNSNYEQLCQLTTIPYVPIWSFGERLAVVEDSSNDPLSVTYSLETIAALLAHRLDQTLLLLDSRDDFVSSARRIAQTQEHTSYSVFLSHSYEDTETALELSAMLEQRGLRTFRQDPAIERQPSGAFHESIDRAAHLLVLLGSSGKFGRWQEYETRTFLRQAASDERTRLVIPISLDDDDPQTIPAYLRQYNIIHLSGNYDATASEIVKLIRSTVVTSAVRDGSLRICATTDGHFPIEGVSVCALADNDTTVTDVTNSDGRSSLQLVPDRLYKLLIAHPRYAPKVIEVVDSEGDVAVRMPHSRDTGSVVVHSTGYIPGLNGRLNPILDRQNRRYLYADNIAVDGGKAQPVPFEVDRSFELEDAQAARFQVTVKLISGRTALLEYRKLA